MIRVKGATTAYERSIRSTLSRFPQWVINAAQISEIVITGGEEMRQVLASYEHGSRKIRVYPGLGNELLSQAIGHEIMHAVDDNFDHPHFFSSQFGWTQLHRDRGFFDIPKYRDEPLEFFADIASKYFLVGRDRLLITHPEEIQFLEASVLPVIQNNF